MFRSRAATLLSKSGARKSIIVAPSMWPAAHSGAVRMSRTTGLSAPARSLAAPAASTWSTWVAAADSGAAGAGAAGAGAAGAGVAGAGVTGAGVAGAGVAGAASGALAGAGAGAGASVFAGAGAVVAGASDFASGAAGGVGAADRSQPTWAAMTVAVRQNASERLKGWIIAMEEYVSDFPRGNLRGRPECGHCGPRYRPRSSMAGSSSVRITVSPDLFPTSLSPVPPP